MFCESVEHPCVSVSVYVFVCMLVIGQPLVSSSISLHIAF